MARIEATSICRQLVANLFADVFVPFTHTIKWVYQHKLIASFSWPLNVPCWSCNSEDAGDGSYGLVVIREDLNI